MVFSEDSRIKIPCILHLVRLGYRYLSLKNAVWDEDTNIFPDLFRTAIARINPGIEGDEIDRLLADVKLSLENEDLGKAFYENLTERSGTRLIDFADFSNNSFHVVTELTCKNGDDEFRPDITLLINGMPLIFIEVKKPNNREGVLAERNRIITRSRNSRFRRFINITQLMVFSNNMEYDDGSPEPVEGAFYASSSYDKPIFNYFREEDELDLTELLVDEDDAVENEVLRDNNLNVIKHSPEFISNKSPHTPTNRICSSLFSRDRLSFLLQYSLAYVNEIDGLQKHVMRYPQLFATKAIERKLDADVRKGIIWHTLFDRVSEYISDTSKRDDFCRAIINTLVEFSFERIFTQKYDFYATLFEYLIKDYNKDSGGKYAEYYTPHAVAKIMAAILVPEGVRGKVKSVSCYDPSAGSGTLLMNLAHSIGEQRCTIYSQDISQKSSGLLRLNLILNNLVHSIPNIIQGNTLQHPYHRDGKALKRFDYIVSNPPFKMDFSDFRNELDTKEHQERFSAGVPNIPKKAREKMAIYQLFLQHIIYSLKPGGKAAVVVPTGFITAQSGIDKSIRQHLVDKKMLAGVVSMPSNIFATTGTNVSILFIDSSNKDGVVLVDASNLGTKVKEGKNQKTLLSEKEEERIITTFNGKQAVEDFSVVVGYDEITNKNYSLSAGQYSDVKIEYVDLTPAQFAAKMQAFSNNLERLFEESTKLEKKIQKQLAGVRYE